MRAAHSTSLFLRVFASGVGLAIVLGSGQAQGACTVATLSPTSYLQFATLGTGVGSAAVSFTLSVAGAGFPADAVVHWGAATRTTLFVHAGLVRAEILYSDVATPGLVNIQVTGTGCTSNLVSPFVVSRLGDFNGDVNGDILWFHPPSGSTLIWLMSGPAYSSSVGVPNPGGTYQPVAVSNVNADGQAHIFWRDSGGNNLIQLMSGTSVAGQYPLPSVPPNWVVGGMADFNLDGYPDILWRDQASGTNLVWLMNGPVVLATFTLPGVGSSWHIAGVFDFQGVLPLILWREAGGTNLVWVVTYDTVVTSFPLPSVDPSWQVAALTDFDGSGDPDILWRHTSGTNLLWLMTPGFAYSSSLAFPFVPPPWQVGGPR